MPLRASTLHSSNSREAQTTTGNSFGGIYGFLSINTHFVKKKLSKIYVIYMT
jgi:hypothetical protein